MRYLLFTVSAKLGLRSFILFSILSVSTIFAQAAPPPKPAPPKLNVPEISDDRTITLCLDCDPKFGFPGHEEANKHILNNFYVEELRKAMYWQDTYHQFESKAHYDNCDFNNSNSYIDQLLQEVREHSITAQNNNGNFRVKKEAVLKAFFALGQALHAVQDFYAHSNYVEIMSKCSKSIDDIPIVHPWTVEGKKLIDKMRKYDGLVSGFVWWGFPQNCANGTASHEELAKDSNETISGRIKIPSLEYNTQYKVALRLATDASADLVRHAFREWPVLKAVNGSYVAFDIMIDKRGL